MPQIPSKGSIDSTLAMLRDPYRFISRQSDAMHTAVPKQDLTLDMTRLPAMPNSHSVMTAVRLSCWICIN